MASQMYGTTGLPGYRRKYAPQINAQRAFLPGIIQRKNEAAQLKLENQFREQELANQATQNQISRESMDQAAKFQQAKMDFQKEESKRGMGMEALKLGITGLGMGGGKTGLPAAGGPGNLWDKAKGLAGKAAPMAFSGLMGYGAGSAFGGKNKAKRALWGAGAGLLSNFLSGTNSLSWGGAGNIGAGLIGGLFS